MKWQRILLALIRCELKAKYDYAAGWNLSAKGVLAIAFLALELYAFHR
jgi:hypothetical protein